MPSSSTNTRVRSEWFIPGAIVFAGLVIALAVYTVRHHQIAVQNGDASKVHPIDTTDHVIGNPTAPVVLIEYADIDSEYSKEFQPVMEQVMQTYGPQGNVAWVYRQFPLIDQDANAEAHAEASECVAAEGSTANFFSFIDAIQSAGAAEFNPSGYDAIVSSLGLSTTDFDKCVTAHTYKNRVTADYQNAIAVGATGAPYSILLVKGQTPIIISGGLPYNTMKQIIDQSISKVLAQ